MTLAALESRLKQDLAWLEMPAKPWVIPRTHQHQAMLEVAIIGGGMAGLAAAASLKMQGIHAVIFDRSPEGFEGPWATTARMETLRSPKHLVGPAVGLPALTFRAWFEAQHGTSAWDTLDKIPRLQWMNYLRWYRKVLALDVRNLHAVERVLPQAQDRVELRIRRDVPTRQSTRAGSGDSASAEENDQITSVFARRVVLATGRDGLGASWVPEFANGLLPESWAHSSDVMDYDKLRGLRVGVIGGSASAMDSAATALEAGAASVDLLIRRSVMPLINKSKGAGSPGLSQGFHQLSDDWRWRIRHYMNAEQTPPPRGSTLRVSRHSQARFNMGCPVLKAEMHGRVIQLSTPKGLFELDFLVFATGFRVNLEARPEFASFASHIRFWRDRYEPEPGSEDEELSESPDLGPAFEFLAKDEAACPGLSRIHCFAYPAVMTHGPLSGDIPAISDGAQRLAAGLAASFFKEDIAEHYEKIKAYADPELLGDEWRVADGPGRLQPEAPASEKIREVGI
jgi:FAD-dependent urate hydroxylase